LEGELLLRDPIIIVFFATVDGSERRVDAQGLQAPEQLFLDQSIGFKTTKGDAAVRTVIDHRTLTSVAQTVALGATVSNVELAPTVSTSQQASEKSSPVASGTTHKMSFHGCVLRDLTLIGLVLIPLDVSLV